MNKPVRSYKPVEPTKMTLTYEEIARAEQYSDNLRKLSPEALSDTARVALVNSARELGQEHWCLSVPLQAKQVLNDCADALEKSEQQLARVRSVAHTIPEEWTRAILHALDGEQA